MFVHVTQVGWLGQYRLAVTFSDGTVREVDLAGELYGEVFEPLRDPVYFRRVCVDPETRTIQWPNGADFAPEYLIEIGQVIETTGP